MTFRKTLFWLHLVCGVVAGLVIGIMAFTGVVLAFEKQLVNWSERDARRLAPPPAGATALPLDELVARARAKNSDARPTAIVVSADPADAVAIAFGRDTTLYADPYTGQVRAPASTGVHDFMHVMEDWHRALGRSGDTRAAGRAITGASNAAFLVLALTGIYLWWPRTWRALRGVALLDFKLRGKPRDWNWHNAIGSWSVLVLIVLTASGVVMSYRWANDLVYRLAGEKPPAQTGPGGAAAPAVEVPKPPPGTHPLGYAALLAAAQKEIPAWDTLTFRLGGPPRSQPRPAAERPAAEREPGRDRETTRPRGPVTVVVRPRDSFPFFANATLSLDPYTGAVLKREAYADLGAGRRARTWLRFLHTGEALGLAGQLVAGLASLGGCFLVYTGFALAWRRFFGKTRPAP